MKTTELREKKLDELETLENSLRRELGELQLKVRMGTSNQTAQIGKVRRTIAQVLTVRQQKQGATRHE